MSHRGDDREDQDGGISGPGGLPREMPPPADLLPRLLDRLSHEGLIRRRPSRRPLFMAAACIAAAFSLGLWLGSREWSTASSPPGGRYALLLYGGEAGPLEADRVEEYRGWARELAASGRAVSGEKLSSGSTVVGAHEEPGDDRQLGGFFIIEAATDEEAADIAARHPHTRHGGTIVVRRIDPT